MAKSKKFDPTKEIPDLKGKIALVTGGNASIGYHTVHQLARHGAKVYLGARSEERAKRAIEKMQHEGLGTGSVEWLSLDLARARTAKAGAELFLTKEDKLDILVNSAGLLARDYELNEDGIVTTFATNFVGPFVFTNTLLPLLEKTAAVEGSDVRIVNVGSDAHSLAPKSVKFASREDFNAVSENSIMKKMSRYGLSKLANVMFTPELQRRLNAKNSPIVVMTVHPGTIASDGAQTQFNTLPWPLPQILWPVVKLGFMSQFDGAITTLFAAASSEISTDPAKYKGVYMVPFGKIEPLATEDANNETLQKQLWETAEKVTEEDLAKGSD
jgi:NAD(P)-dependent dehydrogenase (short-subunit alcohol dehydrogenase family)